MRRSLFLVASLALAFVAAVWLLPADADVIKRGPGGGGAPGSTCNREVWISDNHVAHGTSADSDTFARVSYVTADLPKDVAGPGEFAQTTDFMEFCRGAGVATKRYRIRWEGTHKGNNDGRWYKWQWGIGGTPVVSGDLVLPRFDWHQPVAAAYTTMGIVTAEGDVAASECFGMMTTQPGGSVSIELWSGMVTIEQVGGC